MNDGERRLQDRLGTREQADAFRARQARAHLNDAMRRFIARQDMMFVATADASGECDNTFRAGPEGFVRVLDDQHLSWPEYRGNGVMASEAHSPAGEGSPLRRRPRSGAADEEERLLRPGTGRPRGHRRVIRIT